MVVSIRWYLTGGRVVVRVVVVLGGSFFLRDSYYLSWVVISLGGTCPGIFLRVVMVLGANYSSWYLSGCSCLGIVLQVVVVLGGNDFRWYLSGIVVQGVVLMVVFTLCGTCPGVGVRVVVNLGSTCPGASCPGGSCPGWLLI